LAVTSKKRALISVSDKSGIVALAKFLTDNDYELISTGGTAKTLRDADISVTPVESVTGFPEILDGRVKTLHPKIHGAILARRDAESHQAQAKDLEITFIDLVVANLYPFNETIKQFPNDLEKAIENIDIGGVTLIRAAAKNFKDVVILTHPEAYNGFIEQHEQGISMAYRQQLAVRAFQHTAAYDASITNYLQGNLSSESALPAEQTLVYKRHQTLRYGENPHQKAAFYTAIDPPLLSLHFAQQHNGKELSFNNIADTDAAISIVADLPQPGGVAVKHQNPCAVAIGEQSGDIWEKLFAADPVSVFGGIVAFNCRVDLKAAEGLSQIFLEVIIAPEYTSEAMDRLKRKKNLRILEHKGLALSADRQADAFTHKAVIGGLLLQESDRQPLDPSSVTVVTTRQPEPAEMQDLLFAWQVVKHVRSNAIVLAANGATVGIGPGQTSRVWALESAIQHARPTAKNAVLASDAFFPFTDSIDMAHAAGIRAIIQPGGSIKDPDVISRCNELKMVMIFTGMRHFKH
jgi:phosphoribosylaminoimidazolecarboxamide formyltransferase/IMP cyclohydrolase